MHGNDVSSKGALLHQSDMAIGDTIWQGWLWAAGHYGTGPTVREEDWLMAQVPISSCAIGYWDDF